MKSRTFRTELQEIFVKENPFVTVRRKLRAPLERR